MEEKIADLSLSEGGYKPKETGHRVLDLHISNVMNSKLYDSSYLCRNSGSTLNAFFHKLKDVFPEEVSRIVTIGDFMTFEEKVPEAKNLWVMQCNPDDREGSYYEGVGYYVDSLVRLDFTMQSNQWPACRRLNSYDINVYKSRCREDWEEIVSFCCWGYVEPPKTTFWEVVAQDLANVISEVLDVQIDAAVEMVREMEKECLRLNLEKREKEYAN